MKDIKKILSLLEASVYEPENDSVLEVYKNFLEFQNGLRNLQVEYKNNLTVKSWAKKAFDKSEELKKILSTLIDVAE